MQTLEELIVLHCSPTLALLKPASMFTCPFIDEELILQTLEEQNRSLNKKGIYLCVLEKRVACFLILVYHKDILYEHLNRIDICDFLHGYGYCYHTVEGALNTLRLHMKQQTFPHEIGVFLGYPLDDVISFIKFKGKNYKEIGYWKVYHNCLEAQRHFAHFQQCMEHFQLKLHNGIRLENLVTI